MPSDPHNIWNTNLDIYYYIKRSINLIFTPSFFIIFYCVHKKSPKNFGSLKYFLYFHVASISLQWFYNCLLIDVFQFVPSPFVLIMGFMSRIVNPVYLYIGNYCVTSNTLGSCLTLFCNRLFKIMNLYNSKKSILIWILEIIVYLGVYGFAVSVVPSMASGIPWDQLRAKEFYRNISPSRFYPDIIMNLNVVIVSDPEKSGNTRSIKYNLIHISVVTIIIITSAKLAIWMLQTKMKSRNESEKTRKMHKNFNDRSIFQALIQFLFSTIPFTIVNCLLYFNIVIPEVSYFADIMSELMPLACVLTLFVFYEPYQHFLLVKVGVRHETCNILSTTGAVEKGGVKFSQKYHTVH